MTLSLDAARCHDKTCSQRESCLRWLQRGDTGPRLSHYASLRIFAPFAESCPNLIPSSPVEPSPYREALTPGPAGQKPKSAPCGPCTSSTTSQ